ncbi:hypothetical protein JXO59_10535 [candidate division KSB1 bacterium]|nr:hypothetical protein [candidate division KSB1 bacterium]
MSAVIYFILLLLTHLTTPLWWWIMVLPFFFFMIRHKSAADSFFTAGLGAGLLWLGASGYFYMSGGRIITHRIAEMAGLAPSYLLVIITAFIAFIAAGLSGLCGYYVRDVIKSSTTD